MSTWMWVVLILWVIFGLSSVGPVVQSADSAYPKTSKLQWIFIAIFLGPVGWFLGILSLFFYCAEKFWNMIGNKK